MTHDHTQPDPTDLDIARTLAALNSAAPPEGMEARITQRLSEEGVPHSRAASSRVSGFIAAILPQSAWLRGALTGAFVATAACALAFYIVRPQRAAQSQIATNTSQPPHSATATPVSMTANTAIPCDNPLPHSSPDGVPHRGSAWVGSLATNARVPHPYASFADRWGEDRRPRTPSARTPHLIPASFAPSKPAPPAPLTPQERVLVQLAGNPAALAALTHAATQKSDAEREADFQKFFAPSPELLAAQKAEEQAIHADGSGGTGAPQPTEVHN